MMPMQYPRSAVVPFEETGVMECAPIRAQAWLDRNEGDLGGLPLAAVVDLVERAGLEARVVEYATGGAAQEQQADRVNLRLTADGALGAVDAG
jgi:hypothetical protein